MASTSPGSLSELQILSSLPRPRALEFQGSALNLPIHAQLFLPLVDLRIYQECFLKKIIIIFIVILLQWSQFFHLCLPLPIPPSTPTVSAHAVVPVWDTKVPQPSAGAGCWHFSPPSGDSAARIETCYEDAFLLRLCAFHVKPFGNCINSFSPPEGHLQL